MQDKEPQKTDDTIVVEYARTMGPSTETEVADSRDSIDLDLQPTADSHPDQNTTVSMQFERPTSAYSADLSAATQGTVSHPLPASNTEIPNSPGSQPAFGSDAASLHRKTWSARLRDKLEKREKDAAAAAAQQKTEVQQEKKSRTEPLASTVTAPAKPSGKKTSGGQKKNKQRSHHHLGGSGAHADGAALIGGGMMGGAGGRPNQGKSTPYHLTPSLLEDVLNEKKMSLMRSPEVIEHLQKLQRNVSINRLLGTAPVVKMEDGPGETRVKSESNSSDHGPSQKPLATIGHVMMVNIKKEGDNADGNDTDKDNTEQSGTQKAQDVQGAETLNKDALDTRTAYSQAQSGPQHNQSENQYDAMHISPNSDDTMNNPLDLTAHKNDKS